MSLPKSLNLNDPEAVNRFIGGRRRINAERHYNAVDRRFRLRFFWIQNPLRNQSDLAKMLGVARSTISKDIRALRQEAAAWGRCPCCDKPYPPQDRRPDIEQIRGIHRAERIMSKFG